MFTVLCLCAMYVKYVMVQLRQGYWRTVAGMQQPENYTRWLERRLPRPRHDGEQKQWEDTAQRWADIVRNEGENLPMLYAAAIAGELWSSRPVLHAALVCITVVFRTFHTLYFIFPVQPHRAIVWHLSCLGILFMWLNTLI